MRGRKLDAVDDYLRTGFFVDVEDRLARGAVGGVINCADIRAWKAAALRTVLPVGEHRCRRARVDLNRHCLCCRHWCRRVVWLWSSENQFLDSDDLLAIVVLLELDELWFHILHESLAFSAFELSKKLLNDVVPILVFHHQLQRTCTIAMHCRQLSYNSFSLLICAKLNALFYHIGGELVF